MASKAKKSKSEGGVIERLSHFMADTAIVYVKTLNFHWNMVGTEFFMYHRLLEEQYKEMSEGLDELAERIRMLGGQAPGSMKEFLGLACIPESPSNLSQERMVQQLVKDNESLVEHAHALIEYSDEQNDQGTSDLVIERLRAHDKNAWLLRSHLEKRR